MERPPMTADEPMRSTSGILSEFMGMGGASSTGSTDGLTYILVSPEQMDRKSVPTMTRGPIR